MEGPGNSSDSFSCLHKSRATFIIDPQNFWAQLGLEENFTEFAKFEDLVQEHCAEQERILNLDLPKQFLEKKIVFVKSPKQEKWLRAEVARIAQENVDVYYLDYGTSELVPLENVCVDVPAHFSSQPPYAYRCQLVGIAPIAKSWTSRAVKCFKSLTLDKLLDALVLPSALLYGTCNVALYAGSSQNHRSITHLLLDEEVGLPLGIENIPEFSHQITTDWYQQIFAETQQSGEPELQADNCSETDGACISSPGSDVSNTLPPGLSVEPSEIPLYNPASPGSKVSNTIGPPPGLSVEPSEIPLYNPDSSGSKVSKPIGPPPGLSIERSEIPLYNPDSPGSKVSNTIGPPPGLSRPLQPSEIPLYNPDSPVFQDDSSPLSNPSSPGSEVNSSPGAILRIPSFDTNTMETGHTVTPEVMKITAVIESQKSNRTLYKQQLKDIKVDIAADMELYGVTPGVTTPEIIPPNIVENIHTQIREVESRSSSSDRQAEDKWTENDKPVGVHKSRTFANSSRGRGSGRNSSPRHSPGPSVGRGRARNRNRSSSNSPVCMDHGGNGSKMTNKEETSKLGNQNNIEHSSTMKKNVPLTVKDFKEKFNKILDEMLKEDFDKHKEELISLIKTSSNEPEGWVLIVLDTVLEKAIKLYDSFCPVAMKLLAVCRDLGGFEEHLSSVLWKLQSKYVKAHTSNTMSYDHLNYSRVLGQVFLSSLNWNDSTCLSLRVCVVNSLQKWIIFNKKGAQHSPPVQIKFEECFLELWGTVGHALHTAMYGEWELLVEEIREKVISESKDMNLKRKLLDALLTTMKLTNESTPSVVNQRSVECQTSPIGCVQSSQTPPTSQSDAFCQVNRLTVKSPEKDFLLTPDELEKHSHKESLNYHGHDLQSPEHFVVPRFTVPLSPDQLNSDARLSPIPLVYSRSSPAMERLTKSGSTTPPISARGRRNSQTKPFFDPTSSYHGLPNRYATAAQFNNSYSAMYKRSTPQSSKVGDFCPPLMTPDLFSSPSDSPYPETSAVRDSTIDPTLDASLKVGSNSPFFEIKNPDELHMAMNADNNQSNSSNLSQNHNSLFQNSESDILLQNLGARKTPEPSNKSNKKQLVDLHTGQVLGVSKQVEKSAPVKDKVAPSPSTFSYAAILSTAKQNTENQRQNKAPLSIKSIAMDLLKEPYESENIPERNPPSTVTVDERVLRKAPAKHTEKPDLRVRPPSPWGSVKPSEAWVADTAEFPSLADAQAEKHNKSPSMTDAQVEKHNTSPPTVVSEPQYKPPRDGDHSAFSDDDESDDDEYDDWELRYDASEDVNPAPVKKPMWVPGPRKCTICGDPDHLIYDCPKKNASFLL